MEGKIQVVKGFDSFMRCGGFALEGLAIKCLEEDLGVFVDACVIKVASLEAPGIIDDVNEEAEFESF